MNRLRRAGSRLREILITPPATLKDWWDGLAPPEQLLYSGTSLLSIGVGMIALPAAFIAAGAAFLAVLFIRVWRTP